MWYYSVGLRQARWIEGCIPPLLTRGRWQINVHERVIEARVGASDDRTDPLLHKRVTLHHAASRTHVQEYIPNFQGISDHFFGGAEGTPSAAEGVHGLRRVRNTYVQPPEYPEQRPDAPKVPEGQRKSGEPGR